MMTGTTTIQDLTDDLLTDIFLRLPVKTILRFKSVCKAWRSLLTGNLFVHLHFFKSSLRNPNLFIRTFHAQTLQTLALDSELFHRPVNLNLNLPNVTVLGSCNGLICLAAGSGNEIYLLNPSTREHVHIPSPPIDDYITQDIIGSGCGVTVSMGFGYDPVFDKYKVITAVINQGRSKQIMAYTLGSNTWRMLEDAPLFCFACASTVFRMAQVDGVLHWSGLDQNGDQIYETLISFNLTTEKFGVISCPDFKTERYMQITLGVWNGCLAAFRHDHTPGVHIWVLKEYGVEESWTRIISIGQPPIGDGFGGLLPVVLMKNGDILIQRNVTDFLLYDPVTRTSRNLGDLGFPEYIVSFPYVESLTSVTSLMAGTNLEGH